MKRYELSTIADVKAFVFAGHARNIVANTHGRLRLDRIMIRGAANAVLNALVNALAAGATN
jgi:hypothetical protein